MRYMLGSPLNLEYESDELFDQAVKIVVQYDRASPSLLQRRLSIGYARSARLLDQLQEAGVVSPPYGAKPREVLIRSYEGFIEGRGISDEKEKLEEQALEEKSRIYKQPSLSVVKKPKALEWKRSLFDAVNNTALKKAKGLSFPLGYQDGKLVIKNLEDLSNLIVVGNIVSQKEVMLDSILCSLILKNSPEALKLILIESTRYLNLYEGLPHLLTPVINEVDKSISALRWTIEEADRRFKLISGAGVRDIGNYNKSKNHGQLPHILLVVNQFEELMVFSPVEVEDLVARLTSIGSKVEIHLLLVINRLTKVEMPARVQSNMPNKVFFRLTSKYDVGQLQIRGVESLEQGEALIITEFNNKPQKIDGVYTSENNVKEVVEAVKQD